ncbi:MAG TPA: ribose 5-phosphate isomerase B [Alphaproteobacteria bacterium]|nr:ribose 5-phosphate isomerase B [Alphaproteobacteria bacterium]
MPRETIAIAADHAGFELKALLKHVLEERGFGVLDLGTDSADSTDYPDFAHALARAIEDGRVRRGVLICGSGIGMGMAANRHRGVRAAPCLDRETARLARQHNDANVLALGARLVRPEAAVECLDAFIETPFEGAERHARRLAKLDP